MYKVNFETKELVEIDEVTLKEMNCKERMDCKQPQNPRRGTSNYSEGVFGLG